MKSNKRPEHWPKRPAGTGDSRHLTGETLPVVGTQLQPPSRILALQPSTSQPRSIIFPLNHVHDPAAQVSRRCLCRPQLLPLVHLARPRLRDDLRRGWREQALRLRLCHWTDFRAHGDQLKSQQHQRPTFWTLEPNNNANKLFSHFVRAITHDVFYNFLSPQDFFSETAPITIG